MKTENNKTKSYTCVHCNEENDVVGIIQKETHYYSYYLDTHQWEDFHGDESVESQEFFCINCKEKIDEPSGMWL